MTSDDGSSCFYDAPWEFTSTAARIMNASTTKISPIPSGVKSSNRRRTESPGALVRHHIANVQKGRPQPPPVNSKPRLSMDAVRPNYANHTTPVHDDRPMGEYDCPWDLRRTQDRIKSTVVLEGGSMAESMYDPVARDSAVRQPTLTVMTNRPSTSTSQSPHSSSSSVQSASNSPPMAGLLVKRDVDHTVSPATPVAKPRKNPPKCSSVSPGIDLSPQLYDLVPELPNQRPTVPRTQAPVDVAQDVSYDPPWEFTNTKKRIDTLLSNGAKKSSSHTKPRSQSQQTPTHHKPKEISKSSTPCHHHTDLRSSAASNSKRSTTQHRVSSSTSNKHVPTAKSGMARNAPVPSRSSMRRDLKSTFNPDAPLKDQPWFHSSIPRTEAEHRLDKYSEGAFLVRVCESNKNEYALSLKSSTAYMHMKIQSCDVDKLPHIAQQTVRQSGSVARQWVLGYYSQPFEHIPHMIQYYSHHKLPIKGAEHMCLMHAVSLKDRLTD